MNAKTKRRMVAVTGVIIIVAIVVLAVVGGNSAAKTVSVAEAIELPGDAKIQVTGNVAENSFDIAGDVLTFEIYDSQADPASARRLPVRYDGGVSATFGNDVTAICTGRKTGEGVLNCSELVTKCPSKYESGMDALTVSGLLEYGEGVIDKTVKVSGRVVGGPGGIDADVRFTIAEADSGKTLAVRFEGALPDGVSDGANVVLTGSIAADGTFTATNVALEA